MIRLFIPDTLPDVSHNEVLRYAGYRKSTLPDTDTLQYLLELSLPHIQGRICYDFFPVCIEGQQDMVDLGFARLSSHSLCQLLADSKQVVLFAATLGLNFDRIVARTAKTSSYDAWILHAIGAERIEALADAFEIMLRSQGYDITRRFSPGYGDVPLTLQREVFSALDCPRKIGLTLTETLLMSPSKSVTALAGVRSGTCDQSPKPSMHQCASCSLSNCSLRDSRE